MQFRGIARIVSSIFFTPFAEAFAIWRERTREKSNQLLGSRINPSTPEINLP
jgi:hypothetical protein